MKPPFDISSEVEKTLASLDVVNRAGSNPHLYTRVMARMQREENRWVTTARFLSRPAVVASTLILVIMINAVAFFQDKPEDSPATSATVRVLEGDQLFAQEYNFKDPGEGGFLIANNEQP